MKNVRFFLSENFHFLVVKFSVYLNRHVFVIDVRAIGVLLYSARTLELANIIYRTYLKWSDT